MKNKPYPCTSCGACCRRIDKIVEGFKQIGLEFPYKWDEQGVCEKLVDNKCSVYETRPLMCNIEGVAEYMGIPREEFFAMNIKVCNRLIKEDGLDESFLIRDEK